MTDLFRLLDRLEPPQDGESPVRHRTGTVSAVNTDGTVDLDLGGVVVDSVAVLAGAFIAVGATVQVAVWRGDLLVLGAARTANQGGPLGVLGYAEVTSGQSGISSITDLTGLSVTVTVGSNRRIKITGHVRVRQQTGAGTVEGKIREGTTALGAYGLAEFDANDDMFFVGTTVVESPSLGSHTYKLSLQTSANTVDTLADAAANKHFILVEDLGPA